MINFKEVLLTGGITAAAFLAIKELKNAFFSKDEEFDDDFIIDDDE